MKFNVRDESTGKEFEVEEIVAEEPKKDETPDNTGCGVTDNELSPEEIDALKKLATVADKLVALVDVKDEDPITDEDEDEDEDVKNEGEDKDDDEEVIDTDKVKTGDSIKSSATSIEKRTKTVDAVEEDDISAAWAKRFGGKH
jgi:hypothetical protein